MKSSPKLFLSIGALICVVVIVFIVVYFEPHKLFIDEKTNEAKVGEVIVRSSVPAAENEITTTTAAPLPSQWRSREHQTSGNVLLTSDGNQTYVRFENLKTDNGPDLKVYIAKDLEEDGTPIDFVDLGDLKGNEGDANYAVPTDVNIEDYEYVIIWCKRFSVSFADAEI